MKIHGQLKNQEEIELTISITMTIKEWKDLQDYLPTKYPHWKLGSAITKAVNKINTTVYEDINEHI